MLVSLALAKKARRLARRRTLPYLARALCDWDGINRSPSRVGAFDRTRPGAKKALRATGGGDLHWRPDMDVMAHGKTDEEIANEHEAHMLPVLDIAEDQLGIAREKLVPIGWYKAKIPLEEVEAMKDRPEGNLILVTALTPTSAGEGKTCTSVGLADGLCALGHNAMCALREPSLGPVFGMKGGAAGGGYAQVVPMDDINLHFTGDMHAIGAAHNLLAAMVDNHVKWRKEPRLEPNRITFNRVVDMNDRALRNVVVGLGGVANGFAREDRFDITVASEVMAILCLANDLDDLQRRLGNIIVGHTVGPRKPVTAKDIAADGAMAALLKDAIRPNLVQTLENNPALIHGGPFANIAHGCSSVVATKAALRIADWVVTEGGFGADLGAEKFFNIKCRKAGLKPKCAVVVGTVRALKMHGGADPKNLGGEDLEALKAGMSNLERHVVNVRKFGVPVVVGINRFPTDTDAEIQAVEEACEAAGAKAVTASHHAHGGAGAEDLAEEVVRIVESGGGDAPGFKPLYPDEMPLLDKVRTLATELYGADDVTGSGPVLKKLQQIEKDGWGHLPVCIAKTQYSFSTNPDLKGAPSGHTLPISDVRLSAGAEFVVVLTGSIMTMPGLPKIPAAEAVGVNTTTGKIFGLF